MKRVSQKAIILYRRLRVFKYRLLSDCARVTGQPTLVQPVLMCGKGRIVFEGRCQCGFFPSPKFYSGYGHIEARGSDAVITIGDGVFINNGCSIICDSTRISVGAHTLIGMDFEATDSDFHDLNPGRRLTGMPRAGAVEIGRNVFIGHGVRVLKGVSIGENSVVAAGAIVTRDIPANVIAAGAPARVVGAVPG